MDARVLREVAASHTFDKLLGMPEVMRFIDRDETLAQIFRNPDFLKNGKEFFKTGNGGKVKTSPDLDPQSASAKVFADAFAQATGTPIGGEAPEQQQQQP